MDMPEVKVGEFTDNELKAEPGSNKPIVMSDDFSIWGEDTKQY